MSKEYEWDGAEGFAEFYERFFVPALFGDWAVLTVNAGQIRPGERVLDAACGTGAVARTARQQTDYVTGIDFSDDMLSVARSKDPSITWEKGDVLELPFEDESFEVVFCQFALMFFPDREAALRELKRVGGRIVVTVWDELEKTPGYREFVDLLSREFGPEPAEILTSPFVLGNVAGLAELFKSAGLEANISTRSTTARFPSMEAWITTDVRATPMSSMFSDKDLEMLIEFGKQTLSAYEKPDGTIAFPAPAHIVTAR